jgi:hypothetical protein
MCAVHMMETNLCSPFLNRGHTFGRKRPHFSVIRSLLDEEAVLPSGKRGVIERGRMGKENCPTRKPSRTPMHETREDFQHLQALLVALISIARPASSQRKHCPKEQRAQARCKTRWRSRANPARPYIILLMSLILVTCPSTCPLL